MKILRYVIGKILLFLNAITLPRQLRRDAVEQRKIEEDLKTLKLYEFAACPFCIKVRRALHKYNLPIELRDAKNDSEARAELESGGGKVKVPCLRIEEGGSSKWMYESSDIIKYLETKYSLA